MRTLFGASIVALAMSWGSSALAQDGDAAALLELGDGALVDELDRRYQAGLAASLDRDIVAANDARYLWALEAKVQCAIALGFMESSTRDRTSIGNCDDAFRRMSAVAVRPSAPARPIATPPARRPQGCDDEIVGMVFFEWDSAALSGEGAQTLQSVISNIRDCGWTSLSVVGHTDQSGSDAYNDALSLERAENVTAALRSRGATIRIDTSAQGERNPRVPLADGTRSPQNRRVEISAD